MQNTIGSKLVQIAALRVEALRRLIALAPADHSCNLIRAQLAEAEALLRYRLLKFSSGACPAGGSAAGPSVPRGEEPRASGRAANT